MSKIVGNTVGIPNPQPDWNQNDPTKADYIKNKYIDLSDCDDLVPNLDEYIEQGIYNVKWCLNGTEDSCALLFVCVAACDVYQYFFDGLHVYTRSFINSEEWTEWETSSASKNYVDTELDKRIKYVNLGACKQEIPTELDNLTNVGIYHLDWYDVVSDESTNATTSTKGFKALMIIDNSKNYNDVVQTLYFKERTLIRSGSYMYTLNGSRWQWTSWEEFSKSYVDNKISEEINNKIDEDISTLSNEIYGLNSEIADINIKIDEDIEKEKKRSNSSYSNALKGNVSGEVIRIDDVSPIEHIANVKVSSDTITDFSSVKLIKYGKNLFFFDNSTIETVNNTFKEVEGNNYILKGNYGVSDLAYSTGCLRILFNPPLVTTKDIKISVYVTLLEQGERENKIRCLDSSGRYGYDKALNIGERTKIKLTIGNKLTSLSTIMFYLNNNKVLFELDTLQIEYSNDFTEYEEYTKEEYSVNSDGTVDGVIMNYPTTTLLADTSGVTIDVEYNQDANKVIEKLTNAIIALGGNI